MTPQPVTLVGWGPNIGAAVELAWTAAILFGVVAVILATALVVFVLVRR